MKKKQAILYSGILVLCLGKLFFSVPTVFAYSIYAQSGVSAQSEQTSGGAATTTSYDFGSAWNQLSAPFQTFFNNLGNVSQNDLPAQANPSTQIQSMIPGGNNGILVEILNFLSLVTGWLIGLADGLAKWVISSKL